MSFGRVTPSCFSSELSKPALDNNYLKGLSEYFVIAKAWEGAVQVGSEKEILASEEARHAVESVSRRIALLHIAYARNLILELGEKKGRKVIAKAIKDYGIWVGEKTRDEVSGQGLEVVPENFGFGKAYGIPGFGMHERIETVEVDDEKRMRTHGCILAKVWKEYGEEELGRLYCYVDVAKYMAYNPDYKLVHTKTLPDGHDCCELVVRRTTYKEKLDFSSKRNDWLYIDK